MMEHELSKQSDKKSTYTTWSKYVYPQNVRSNIENILSGSKYFVRDAAKGHTEGIYISPVSSPRTRTVELYYSAKGLTIYPSKDYIELAERIISKPPVFYEKFAKKHEFFCSEEELYNFASELRYTNVF